MTSIENFRGEHRFLSNFSESLIRGAGDICYPTAEAAFQGGKTRDMGARAKIAAAPTPEEAKRLGRRVRLIPDWDEHRHVVMRAVLRAKFADPDLGRRLLDTGDAELVEGNRWHDQFWGCCRCGTRPLCADPGENWLGRHLMALRSDLAAPPAAEHQL